MAIVVERGEVVDVKIKKPVGEHCCDAVIGAKVERDADFGGAKMDGRR